MNETIGNNEPGAASPMNFRLVDAKGLLPDPMAAEAELLQQADQPMAMLWQTHPCLVVPRSYRKHAGFGAAGVRFADAGWPVYERPSGGGLVPQGPGILNLSLAYTLPGPPGRWTQLIYRHLCALLQEPLDELGITTHLAAVPDSFCDGRFNLACGEEAQARKIAGTAQYWRLLPATALGPHRYAVLVHAVLLVDPDLEAMHRQANALEEALDTGRRYDAARTTSVSRMLAPGLATAAMAAVRPRLRQAVTRASPPQLPQDQLRD